MIRSLALLGLGEALLLAGLGYAWLPLAPIAAGLQLIPLALLRNHADDDNDDEVDG